MDLCPCNGQQAQEQCPSGRHSYCCADARDADAPFHDILCSAPVDVRPTGPAKGLGVFATRALRPGELIFEERPTIVSPAHGALDTQLFVDLDDVELGVRGSIVRSCALQLTFTKALMQLSDNSVPKTLLGVAHTNGVAIDAHHGALFLAFSRLNHACTPSAHFEYNPETRTQSVYVLRPIAAGEEVTVSYKDREMHMPRLLRRLRLFSTFGFECACTTCNESCESTVAASDARRVRVARLHDDIYEAMEGGDPAAAVRLCEERTMLLMDEGLGSGVDMANSLFLLSRALHAAGREADAQRQMQLCVHESTRCRGADHPVTRGYVAMLKQ